MRTVVIIGLAVALSSCGTLSRLSEIGRPPARTPTADPPADPAWRPVTMPMPRPDLVPMQVSSLWRSGSRAFFRDQRAAQVGDILTVLVDITDNADFENNSTATRAGTEAMGIPNLFGLKGKL